MFMFHSAVNTEWNLTKYRIILQFSKDLGLNPALLRSIRYSRDLTRGSRDPAWGFKPRPYHTLTWSSKERRTQNIGIR